MCCCRAMLRFAGTRNIGSVTEASTKSPALRAEAPLRPALTGNGLFADRWNIRAY